MLLENRLVDRPLGRVSANPEGLTNAEGFVSQLFFSKMVMGTNSAGWGIMLFWLGLFFSNREHHKRAGAEVFIVSVVSIFPLLLLPFISSVKSGAEIPFDVINTIWTAISAGQLFLYSFAMLGMIIWLSVEDVSNTAFPPRKYFIVAAFLTAFVCLLAYESDPGLSKPLNPFMVRMSIWIYGGYLLMYYMLLVFKMVRAPALSASVETDVGGLIDQSRRRRGDHND